VLPQLLLLLLPQALAVAVAAAGSCCRRLNKELPLKQSVNGYVTDIWSREKIDGLNR